MGFGYEFIVRQGVEVEVTYRLSFVVFLKMVTLWRSGVHTSSTRSNR
jgi:hypothetical protein